MSFSIIKSDIEGLFVIQPKVFEDNRGCFFETYNTLELQELGLDAVFVQDNQTISYKGVLRGVHLQKKYPQTKLVRVIRGEIWDVAVDLRKGSSTYGNWYGLVLSSENKKQLYIPKDFGHGFFVFSEVAEVCFKVTDYYHPGDEIGFIWNDPDIGIKWPILDETEIILADKDKNLIRFKELFINE